MTSVFSLSFPLVSFCVFLSVNTKDTSVNNDDRSDFLRSDDELSSPSGLTDTIRAAVPVVTDIEDLCNQPSQSPTRRANDFCSSSFGCNGQSRQQCNELIKTYKQQQQVDFNEFYINTQSLRHTVFLILLLCSMFVVSCNQMESIQNTYQLHLNILDALLVNITFNMDAHNGRNVWYLH